MMMVRERQRATSSGTFHSFAIIFGHGNWRNPNVMAEIKVKLIRLANRYNNAARSLMTILIYGTFAAGFTMAGWFFHHILFHLFVIWIICSGFAKNTLVVNTYNNNNIRRWILFVFVFFFSYNDSINIHCWWVDVVNENSFSRSVYSPGKEVSLDIFFYYF